MLLRNRVHNYIERHDFVALLDRLSSRSTLRVSECSNLRLSNLLVELLTQPMRLNIAVYVFNLTTLQTLLKLNIDGATL